MPISLLHKLTEADRARLAALTGPLTTLRPNAEGTGAEVLHLNETWVLRVGRGDAGALDRETGLLAALEAHLPDELAALLPLPRLSGPGWHLCPQMPGAPTGRRALARLPAGQRKRLLETVGRLLPALHAAPVAAPAAATPHAAAQWQTLLAEAEAALLPLLSPNLAAEVRALLADMAAAPLAAGGPALIHDDLHPAHILHDPATGRLTGLLDFGRSGRGDAAVDLAGLLYNWGQEAVGALDYPGASALLPRARRLARTYEAQWALEGLRRQDPRWLLYALGAAKDF